MKVHVESLVWELGSASAGEAVCGCRYLRPTKVLQIGAVVDESDDYVLVSTNLNSRLWNQNLLKIPKRIIQERFAIYEAESTDQNISLEFLMSKLTLLTPHLLRDPHDRYSRRKQKARQKSSVP